MLDQEEKMEQYRFLRAGRALRTSPDRCTKRGFFSHDAFHGSLALRQRAQQMRERRKAEAKFSYHEPMSDLVHANVKPAWNATSTISEREAIISGGHRHEDGNSKDSTAIFDRFRSQKEQLPRHYWSNSITHYPEDMPSQHLRTIIGTHRSSRVLRRNREATQAHIERLARHAPKEPIDATIALGSIQ